MTNRVAISKREQVDDAKCQTSNHQHIKRS